MDDTPYFTVEPTAMTIPKRGSLAIYCGDKSRTNEDGTRSLFMRAPLLLMPDGMFSDAPEVMEKVARILNEHAAEFYASAKPVEATP